MQYLKNAWYQRLTQGINPNVGWLLSSEILWSVPTTWTKTYAPLFMAALGLSPVQIGGVASLALIVQMLVSPFGGYAADRFGRKRVLVFTDAFCWVLPMAIWMFAQNFWFFVVAAVLNGIGALVGPSWICLLVEDTEPSRRTTVFAWFRLVVLGAGLFAPIVGLIMSKNSVVVGSRIIYGIALLSMLVMLSIRAAKIKETSVGSRLSIETRGMRVREYFGGYRQVFSQSIRQHTLIVLFFLGMINYAYLAIWDNFSALYMTHQQGLDLSPALVAAWPTFSSAIMILILIMGVPRIKHRLAQWLTVSSASLCLGILLFVLAKPGSYVSLAIAAVLIGVGLALINPVRDTFLANVLDDNKRATVLAAMNSLGLMFVVPLTPLAGKMFEYNPRAPLLMLLGMLALGIILSGSLLVGKRVNVGEKRSTYN